MIEKSAIEKMMDGYNVTENKQDGGQELATIQKDDKTQRELSPIEKLMNGYHADSTQRQKEVEVNPNEIKEDK
ncbi:hypothetical protein ACQCWA_19415 [Rossellomorea aquimaris]|uniref:hypothetical protein n=1 Tax=Rossellomorea aquimaris TaxID=189382 RepID=UPI003CEA0F04